MVDEVEKQVDLIARTQLLADRLEKENARYEENIKRLEVLESQKILGGKSSAGEPVVEKKVETPSEYAKRMLRGGV